MQKLLLASTLFALALSAVAQQGPSIGRWNCGGSSERWTNEDGNRICTPSCLGATREWTYDPERWICPNAVYGIPEGDIEVCESLGNNTNPVTCYPPGTDPRLRENPGQGDDLSPQNPRPSDIHKKALVAFGGAFLAGIAIQSIAPHLPDGLTVRPNVHAAYRDGLMMTSAELTADWRKWTVSASAVNFQGEWSRPYARVRWTWVF